MKKKTIGLFCAMLLTTAALAGCGDKTEPISRPRGTIGEEEGNDAASGNNAGNESDVKPGNADDGAGVNDGGNGNSASADGMTCVKDVEGLLMAIEPGAKIVLEPGTYNLSDYLVKQWNTPDAGWEKIKAKGYVWMEKVFDGVQVHFDNVDGLSIIGRSPDRADTQILTDPRYASLFIFHSSKDVMLSNLTMGHTDRGECVGNVLDFMGCSEVLLVNMDIFGCGVYGIGAMEENGKHMGSVHVYDTLIRDCYYGPLNIEDPGSGDWYFSRCELSGSTGGGYFSELYQGKLYFYDCVFGDRESENFYFRDDAVTENCTWGNIEVYPEYPEYGYEGPVLEKNQLKVAPFDAAVLNNTSWSGLSITDETAGTTVTTPAWLYFYADGTAVFSEDDTSAVDLSWTCDGHYSADLYDEDGKKWGGVTLYYDQGTDGSMFMNVTKDNGSLWFFH